MASRTKKYGHWTSKYDIDPDKQFGFVYIITYLETGKSYIGKKQFFSYKKTKKFKELDWRNYTGSSKELNQDIKTFGKDKFSFQILFPCYSRGSLTYAEANLQHNRQVLVDLLKDGSKKYYNKNIAGIKFIPKLTDDERKEIVK